MNEKSIYRAPNGDLSWLLPYEAIEGHHRLLTHTEIFELARNGHPWFQAPKEEAWKR